MTSPDELPAWARWNADPERPAWTVGLEEEVMLLDPEDWTLANRIDDLALLVPVYLRPAQAEISRTEYAITC